jgi:hypothetical protein
MPSTLDISIDYFSKPLDDLDLTFNKKRGINVYSVQKTRVHGKIKE